MMRLFLAAAMLCSLSVASFAQQTGVLTYSQSFDQGVAYPDSSIQATAWQSFRQSLPSEGVQSITIRGSMDTVGRTCSDADTAQDIANSLRNGSGLTDNFTCGGITWGTGNCRLGSGVATELRAGNSGGNCSCSSDFVVRPRINNGNWGGIAGPTCNAPSQTMIVDVVVGPTLDEEAVSQAFEETTSEFLQRRVDRLLANRPDASRFDRHTSDEPGTVAALTLSGTAAGVSGYISASGKLGDEISGSAQLQSMSSNINAGQLAFKLHSTSEDRAWRSWVEAHFSSYRDASGSLDERDGRFGVLHIGADFLVNSKLAVGFSAQRDWMSEDVDGYSDVSGIGWMVGPYISGQIAEDVYFSVGASWGRSSNDIEIDAENDGTLWNGSFDTERRLVEASIYGSYEIGQIYFLPKVDLSYIKESADAYSVTDGVDTVDIDEVEVSLLRFNLSGEAEWRDPIPGIGAYPFVRPEINWNISSDENAEENKRFYTSVHLGLRSAPFANWRGQASIGYEGIGDPEFSAVTAKFDLQWTF